MSKNSKSCNIRFNCISPAGILDDQPKKFLNRYKKHCINKCRLNPEELTMVGTYNL